MKMNVRRENVGRSECQTIAQQFNNYKNADQQSSACWFEFWNNIVQQLSSALQEQVWIWICLTLWI